MNILFVANRFPYPPFRGDKLKIYNLTRRLAQKHNLFLVTFYEERSELNYLKEIHARGKTIIMISHRLDNIVENKETEYEPLELELFLDGKGNLFESDVGLRIRNFFPFVNELADLPDDDVGTFGIPPFIEKIRVGSWQS